MQCENGGACVGTCPNMEIEGLVSIAAEILSILVVGDSNDFVSMQPLKRCTAGCTIYSHKSKILEPMNVTTALPFVHAAVAPRTATHEEQAQNLTQATV